MPTSFLNHAAKTAPNNQLADVIALAQTQTGVIDLTVGDPDFTTPQPIANAGTTAINNGATHYAPALGVAQFRNAVANLYTTKYQLPTTSANILATVGASHALLLALFAIIDPGDEVIIPTPSFAPYPNQVKLAGGTPVIVELDAASHFAFDAEKIAAAITAKTKAIIINYPNNPTGNLLSENQAVALANLAKKHHLVIISDEIYSEFTPNNQPFIPFAKFAPENTITVSGLSKNFAMTGWRLGYMMAAPEIIAACCRINEDITYAAPTMAQHAGAFALAHNDELTAPIVATFQKRLTYLKSALAPIEWLDVVDGGGAIYCFVDIRQTKMTALDFTHKLLEQTGVLVVPGSAFGTAGEGFIRIAATKDLATLKQAVAKITDFKF